jgi:hypothetical protein
VGEEVFKFDVQVSGMNFDEDVEEGLRERTQEMIEEEFLDDGMEDEIGMEMKHKSGPRDEKIERDAFSKTGANPSPEEIEFLVRQRTSMDNEELEKFLSGDHEARKKLGAWEPFTATEEKFLLQNIQSQNLEELADHLNRDPEQLELQLKIMGLDREL